MSILRSDGDVYSARGTILIAERIPCRYVDYGETKYVEGSTQTVGKAQFWIEEDVDISHGDILAVFDSESDEECARFKAIKVNKLRDLDGYLDHIKVIAG